MYARMVKGQFKPEKFDFVTTTLEKDVIPLLKKQKGFKDELLFFDRNIKEGYAISFWDSKADLEKYEREVYPKVHEKMAQAFMTTGRVTPKETFRSRQSSLNCSKVAGSHPLPTLKITSASVSPQRRTRAMCVARFSPSSSSMTTNGTPADVSPSAKTCTTWGLRIRLASRTSRAKRSR